MMRTWAASQAILLWALLLACPASAGDFRVDTDLFQGDEKEPFLTTLTVFSNGIVYDFRWTEPKEVTVFNPLHGKFTLLDESRKVKATILTQELLDFTLALEQQAAQQRGLFAFCAEPKFAVVATPVEENGQMLTELRLSAKPLTYVVKGQKPEHADSVKAYRQFADWCARLNAAMPGNLPPAARLELNEQLAENELLPLEITRTIPGTTKSKIVRSQHRVNWALSDKDQKNIGRAGDMMATFEAVSFNNYRGEPDKAANKQVRR